MSRDNFGIQSIESKLTSLLKPLFQGSKKEFLVINNLVKNWDEIVGKKYAKLCYPKSINFIKNSQTNFSQGRLTIGVYNSSVGFFLEYNNDFLFYKIATLYGYKAINRIIIKQEPKQIKPRQDDETKLSAQEENILQEKTKNIENIDLAQTLQRLGRELMRK